ARDDVCIMKILANAKCHKRARDDRQTRESSDSIDRAHRSMKKVLDVRALEGSESPAA
ncbi:MAG: hypothetical protein JWO39_1411, partial [Gemmatimonadetes bacterium]|nr:hypothetical protein [Gemmatimonadota bacterium]